jgi:flagellar biosynthesis/type III secretory pathway protein FliH
LSNVFSGEDHVVRSFADALAVVPDVRGPNRQGRHLHELRESAREEGRIDGAAIGIAEGRIEGERLGFAAGMIRATAEGKREREEMLANFARELQTLASAAQDSVTRWCEAVESQLTDRVAAIAREVIQQELELDRSSVLAIVQNAMREVTHARHARIRINPLDKELIVAHKDEIVAAVRNLDTVELIFDDAITAGCTIETDGGVVEASSDSQLKVLELRIERGAA